MKDEIKIFSYDGTDVPMRSADGEIFVNLTQVAKRFPDKNLSTIINSQEIKEYCDALLKLKNFSFRRKSEIKNFSSADLLKVRKGGINGGGTWAQRKVAIRVAQKLSPELAVWIDAKIEEVLFGAKNNADNGLFDTFANTFGCGEQQISAAPSEADAQQYVTKDKFNALVKCFNKFCEHQTNTNTLVAETMYLFSEFVTRRKLTLSKKERTQLAQECDSEKIYSFTEAAKILGYHRCSAFVKMLVSKGFIIQRFNRYYPADEYISQEYFYNKKTQNGSHAALGVTARGMQFLQRYIAKAREKEFQLV
jgi:hypothetical protein